MQSKRGLGPVVHGDREMPFGKGAVAGGLVFLSGAEGRHPDTGVPVEGIRAQTEVVFEKIRSRLADAGATLDDIVKLTCFVTDRGLKDEFMAARDDWLRRNCPDLIEGRAYASTLLFVNGMSHEDMLLEVECVAYVGE
jgi:enamine deaminase RidA (YjgF/YER057c/UK114 family)